MSDTSKLQPIEIVFKGTAALPSRSVASYLADEATLTQMAENFYQHPMTVFRYNVYTTERKPQVLFLSFENVLYIG